MALVKQSLKDAIKTALQNALDEEWSLDEVATAWADAIHGYVSQGEISGVTSNVSVNVPITGASTEHGTGTASQSGSVHVT